MLRTFRIEAAATLCGVLALACPAKATTLVLTGPSYDANLIWNNDGTVSLVSAPTVDYTAVQQQSELWWNFSSGSSLPAGSLVTLSFATVGGQDHHTISFADSSLAGSGGGVFTWGYNVSEVPSFNDDEQSLSADILQTVGAANLVKVLTDNFNNPYELDFVQIGTTTIGVTTANFVPGVTSLVVAEQLTVASGGSDISAISNSYTETPVPEPATWAMLALGFVGLGFVGYRKANGRRAAFSEA